MYLININYLLFLLLTTISIVCCQNKKEIILDREDFSISYLKYLKLDESGHGGSSFILSVPHESNDNFVENINLIKTKLVNPDFKQFTNKTISDVSNIANIIENKIIDLNGEKCLRLIFELREQETDIIVTQHTYIKNSMAYILTFTTESKNYNKYLKEMNEILMSFKIK